MWVVLAFFALLYTNFAMSRIFTQSFWSQLIKAWRYVFIMLFYLLFWIFICGWKFVDSLYLILRKYYSKDQKLKFNNEL